MTKAKFLHAKISGVCTVIPKKRIKLDDEINYYSDKIKVKRLKSIVGINERAVVSDETTPSDLMEQAAQHLIDGMNLDRDTIDAIVCVLDFPDYKCPPTSCVLQGKLNLPTTCMALDITHGCAGYVYGLYIAYSMVESGGCNKVLLLVGDTKSRTINVKDRISAPIFGDGAAATLVERTDKEDASYFVLGADGTQFDNIIVPAGGARLPSSVETAKEEIDEFGNIRSLDNFRMNGRNVFDFTMNIVPKNIKEVLQFSGIKEEEIDYFVLHQANKAIVNNIASVIGIEDLSRFPIETLAKIGNLAVASIPSAINDQLSKKTSDNKNKLLLSGFGVGLSFASTILTTDKIFCPNIFEYKEND